MTEEELKDALEDWAYDWVIGVVEDDKLAAILAAFAALRDENALLRQAVEAARTQLRATQRNWDEQCLFECDDILTRALSGAEDLEEHISNEDAIQAGIKYGQSEVKP